MRMGIIQLVVSFTLQWEFYQNGSGTAALAYPFVNRYEWNTFIDTACKNSSRMVETTFRSAIVNDGVKMLII